MLKIYCHNVKPDPATSHYVSHDIKQSGFNLMTDSPFSS